MSDRELRKELAAAAVPERGRRWLYVPYDQLTDELGPLAREAPDELGVVLVESAWKAARRPYHRQKLALVLASQRHFAVEQARRGVAVRYVMGDAPYRELLAPLARELGPLRLMEPAERELRVDLAPLVDQGRLELLPHEGWLTPAELFESSCGAAPPWRMDAFYRAARRASGLLMRDGAPEGGRFSFDAENRRPWRGEPPAPEPPRFEPDALTREVGELVLRRFARHPGRLDLAAIPATRADVETLWRFARERCLPFFGPFEDALSTRSRGLFHTRLAPLLHLHRLLPARVVREAAALELPIASREGFVRQVLGWREFVRHVHRATDGFRAVGDARPPVEDAPGDGGWSRWSGEAWRAPATAAELDGGARPSFLRARGPLPPAYWGAPSGLACLDRSIADVWDEGWGHHIPRLMVLANLATLLDVAPRELTDWFWCAYVDAYDWVVEPNVLGMGSFAVGDAMTTKPYVCGAAYLDRMGDHCAGCRFDPKRDCPITSLYWDFLARKRALLGDNPRLRMPLASLAKRSAERREADARVADDTRRRLRRGEELRPGRS